MDNSGFWGGYANPEDVKKVINTSLQPYIDILSQVSDLKSQGTGIAESNAKIEDVKQSEIAQQQKRAQSFSGR